MATHSSVLAWRIPGTGEPGGLPSVYGVTQSRTQLKQLSGSSSLVVMLILKFQVFKNIKDFPQAYTHVALLILKFQDSNFSINFISTC